MDNALKTVTYSLSNRSILSHSYSKWTLPEQYTRQHARTLLIPGHPGLYW